jgi:autotransporter family porin
MFGFGFTMFSAIGAVSADEFTIYVGAGGNDAYDGQSAIWNGTSGPKSTIKNATDTVFDEGTIILANGVYAGSGNVNIAITKNVTIIGKSRTGTIINGANSGPIFGITGGKNVVIQNITFIDGSTVSYSTGYGGAINNNGNLIVDNCAFTDNTAESIFYTLSTGYGGAIYNGRGTLAVTNSIFTGNKAWYGGAIYSSGPLTVKGCTFTNNSAEVYSGTNSVGGNGGAINGVGSTITGNTFMGNTAKLNGGAINGGGSTITGNTFLSNTAMNGGAFNGVGSTITSNNFVGNTAMNGGAIWNSGTLNLHFNRIVGNTASYGSAVYAAPGSNDNGTLNWWGSNAKPSGIYGNVNVSNWLILTLTADIASIKTNGTSIIKADLLHDSQGGYHNPANGYVPNGIPVNFGTTLGTIGNQASTIHGIAQSTLNGVPKLSVITVSAKIDNQKVTKILDTIPPKIISTNPSNGATGISRTSTIAVKFSENIKSSTNWSKIFMKNLTTGKIVTISKSITGNTLYIKMSLSRLKNNTYQIYIPTAAVNDYTGNNLAVVYSFKFKTA